MSLYAHVCLCSLAIHPDQVRVATGQVAGHDQKEGKVGGQSSMSINITMSGYKKTFCKKKFIFNLHGGLLAHIFIKDPFYHLFA